MSAEERIEKMLGPVVWPGPMPTRPFGEDDIGRLINEVATLQRTVHALRLGLLTAAREIDELSKRRGK